jgi:hypothetical protein
MAKKNKQKKFNPNPGTSKFDGGLLGYIGWGFCSRSVVRLRWALQRLGLNAVTIAGSQDTRR